MYRLRGGHRADAPSLASFIAELIEAAIADFRLVSMQSDDPSVGGSVVGHAEPRRNGSRKLTAARITELVTLFKREKISVRDLGRRFGIAPTSVRRLLGTAD